MLKVAENGYGKYMQRTGRPLDKYGKKRKVNTNDPTYDDEASDTIVV